MQYQDRLPEIMERETVSEPTALAAGNRRSNRSSSINLPMQNNFQFILHWNEPNPCTLQTSRPAASADGSQTHVMAFKGRRGALEMLDTFTQKTNADRALVSAFRFCRRCFSSPQTGVTYTQPQTECHEANPRINSRRFDSVDLCHKHQH